LRELGHRLRELYNHSNAQAKGSACVRARRFAARRNCYLPLNRSRRISMPREFRSTGRSGRRGRSIHELTIAGWEQTRTRDSCLRRRADVFVCSAAIAKLSGYYPNRLNWLPFKSALTEPHGHGVVPPNLRGVQDKNALTRLRHQGAARSLQHVTRAKWP